MLIRIVGLGHFIVDMRYENVVEKGKKPSEQDMRTLISKDTETLISSKFQLIRYSHTLFYELLPRCEKATALPGSKKMSRGRVIWDIAS